MLYEIRVMGHAVRTIGAAFDEFDVSIEPGATVLRADLVDQSALQGVLARLHSMGLELVGLSRSNERELELLMAPDRAAFNERPGSVLRHGQYPQHGIAMLLPAS